MTAARLATAHHEAGHAVAAFYVGWGLDARGVNIIADDSGALGHTYTFPGPAEWTPSRYAHSVLAGPLCEARFEGRNLPLRTDARRLESIACARDWLARDAYEGDHAHDAVQVAAMLLTIAPNAVDESIASALATYEAVVWEMVQRSDFCAAVERVAAALMERERLCPYDVRRLCYA